jgi:hypothetical protein
VTAGGDTDVADRSLELDQRMCLVVVVCRTGFTVGTEVQIAANSALVSSATDVVRIDVASRAKRSITADANVNGCWCAKADIFKWFVDWGESVTRVDNPDGLHASRTIIPVRAVEALVTNTCNVVVTAITYGVMRVVTAWVHLGCDIGGHLGALDSGCKTVLGVMPVSILGETLLAKVKVLAYSAV